MSPRTGSALLAIVTLYFSVGGTGQLFFVFFFLFYTFHTCKDGMASIGQFGDWSAIISMILLSKMAFLRDCFVYCRFFSIFFCVSMQSDGYILR